MAPLITAAFSAVSKIALSVITRLLTEKYLKKFIRDLLLAALKKYAARTETDADDKLIKLIEEAFADEDAGK